LLRRFRERTGFIGALQAVLDFSEIKHGKRKAKATAHYIEAAANGHAIIETVEDKLSGVIPVNPKDYGDKVSRAAAISPQVQAGNVYLPDGAEWLGEYIGQHGAFPNGENDDEVDQTSQVLLMMAESETSFSSRFARAVKEGTLLRDNFGISARG
jgi:predicted phage terminase large subunit-like protein